MKRYRFWTARVTEFWELTDEQILRIYQPMPTDVILFIVCPYEHGFLHRACLRKHPIYTYEPPSQTDAGIV